ncbi:MAG: ATP-binding protein [Methanosarcinaceae archaeon]
MTIRRHILANIQRGLTGDKIPVICGPRYFGKHDAIKELRRFLENEKKVPANRIQVFDLDNILVQLAINEDVEQFKSNLEKSIGEQLEKLTSPVYLFFEQLQNSIALVKHIAEIKQLNPAQIKIVVSASINLESNQDFINTLLPLSKIHYLYPLSLNELISNNIAPLNDESVLQTIFRGEYNLEYFKYIQWIVEPYKKAIMDFLPEYAIFGGLPTVYTQNSTEARWQEVQQYMRHYFEKDLRIVYQIADLKKFNNIIKILSLNNGKILNLLNLCDYYHFNRNTIRKYSKIMRETFLLDFVKPFLKNKVKKAIMRTPKLYFINPGLANYLTGHTTFHDSKPTEYMKSSLDSMLYVNLRTTKEEVAGSYDISFLRDYQEHELDFLLVSPEKITPVGVTFSEEDRKVKIKTFRYYLRYCDQISDGIIFGRFDKIELLEMRGSRLFLLPLWMLW